MRRFCEEAQWITGSAPIAIKSGLSRKLEDYPSAWRECERVLNLARRFDRSGILTAQDFGPSASSTASERARVQRDWQDWWAKHKK